MRTIQAIGLAIVFLVGACPNIEVRSGEVSVSFYDCPGQVSTVLIEQPGGGTTPNKPRRAPD